MLTYTSNLCASLRWIARTQVCTSACCHSPYHQQHHERTLCPKSAFCYSVDSFASLGRVIVRLVDCSLLPLYDVLCTVQRHRSVEAEIWRVVLYSCSQLSGSQQGLHWCRTRVTAHSTTTLLPSKARETITPLKGHLLLLLISLNSFLLSFLWSIWRMGCGCRRSLYCCTLLLQRSFRTEQKLSTLHYCSLTAVDNCFFRCLISYLTRKFIFAPLARAKAEVSYGKKMVESCLLVRVLSSPWNLHEIFSLCTFLLVGFFV